MTAKTRACARRYIEHGFAPIPVPVGSKNPNRLGWESEQHTLEDVPRCWTNGQNVGLLTGAPSKWLVDVDLDVLEAVAVAGRFLEPTRTSGHGQALNSHWWYHARDAETKEYRDTDGKKKFTINAIALEIEKMPAAELEHDVNKLATAALIARHLPEHRKLGGGGRHDYALALAGFMLRDSRLDQKTVLTTLVAAWDVKGWPSEHDRREAHKDLERAV